MSKLGSIKLLPQYNMMYKIAGPIKVLSEELNIREKNSYTTKTNERIQKYNDHLLYLGAQILNGIRNRAEISKDKINTVCYPCGGVDVHAPFGLLKEITNVISVAIHPFGTTEDFRLFTDKYAQNKLVMNNEHNDYDAVKIDDIYLYDNHNGLNQLLNRNNMCGPGSLAMARIMHLLGGRIEGLYYFDLKEKNAENCNIRFLDENEIKNYKNCSNAVVVFNACGTEKRFWYIQNDLYCSNKIFNQFINAESLFQILLIKGAMDVFYNYNMATSILSLSKENNLLVIADQGSGPRYPIMDYSNKETTKELFSGPGFGYGNFIYYCLGKDLVF